MLFHLFRVVFLEMYGRKLPSLRKCASLCHQQHGLSTPYHDCVSDWLYRPADWPLCIKAMWREIDVTFCTLVGL